ncbi:MAG: esterase/lipase family protein, partial [Desulfobaccales bacterium]
PLPPETVWSVLTKDWERISLHPNNIRFEAMEPARLKPDQIYDIAYQELVQELRHNLSQKADEPVPVFPFAYDWRQPLSMIEEQLSAFVWEVIERTQLLKHYYDLSYGIDPKVNLVGHSMGGLIITGYLEKYGRKAPVTKVATLASPFRGSYEAVLKVTTGTTNLGGSAPSSREREAARVMPALYHLLPSCPGLEVDPGLPESLFDPAIWQPSILQTLEEYVRLYAVSQEEPEKQARDLFAALLDSARKHRNRLENFRLEQAGLTAQDWLCVIGVDSTTRVRLKVIKTPEGPDFQFRSEDRDNRWDSENDPADRRLTGDGTVPFAGALPAFLALENVVCVSPDDYGYWEIQDKLVTKVAGFHGILPNMDMLHRLIVRHFTGWPDDHGNTWGRPAPGVTAWQPPLALKQKPERE